jgi:hypothetical protein
MKKLLLCTVFTALLTAFSACNTIGGQQTEEQTMSNIINVETTPETTVVTTPAESETKPELYEKLNPEILSELGMSGPDIIEKYGYTDVITPSEYLNLGESHYTLGMGEFAEYGVVSAEAFPFTELFTAVTVGISADDIAKMYGLRIISRYNGEMNGEEVIFFDGEHEIRLWGLENDIATASTGATIVNADFWNRYKYGIALSDYDDSVIKYFTGSTVFIVPGTDVETFKNDPVTAKLLKYMFDNYPGANWQIGGGMTEGVIEENTSFENFEGCMYYLVWDFKYWN